MALSGHKHPVYENLDNSKRLHSENDEPAKVVKYFDPISANGDLTQAEWYHHGYRHRKNGPAIERTDGHKEWWDMDTRHNPTGPAIIRADGTGTFYIYDDELTPEKIKAACGARVTKTPPYFESQTDRMIWLEYASRLMADPMNAAVILQKVMAAEIKYEIDQEIIKAIVMESKFQTLSLSPELCARTEPTKIDLSSQQSIHLGGALPQASPRLPSVQS